MARFSLKGVVGFLGPFGIGKDHAAKVLGIPSTAKFASGLYQIAEALAGRKVDKALPGWRRTLCQIGAWGRGEVSDEFPMSAERALFEHSVRAYPGFDEFGSGPEFWLRRGIAEALDRAAVFGGCALTDIRYTNELFAVVHLKVPVFALACRPEVIFGRRRRMGYPEEFGMDRSERLGNDLFVRLVAGNLPPPYFGVTYLWSDTPETCPSNAVPLFV